MKSHLYAEIFPMMNPDEFERLTEDIRLNGLINDIITFKGLILDGRNRYLACKKAGVGHRYRDWDGRGSALQFVLSVNLNRRYMNASQLALSAAKAKPLFEEEARKRQLLETSDQANLQKGQARDAAAQIFNVSPRLVETASAVIRDGADELVQMVLDGEVRVSAALPVAVLPKTEQHAAIGKGAKHIQKMSSKARVGSCKKLMARIHKS